jgi:hypothetical protein
MQRQEESYACTLIEAQEQCLAALSPAQDTQSFVMHALMVVLVDVVVYVLGHTLLVAHRVLTRHQELLEDRRQRLASSSAQVAEISLCASSGRIISKSQSVVKWQVGTRTVPAAHRLLSWAGRVADRMTDAANQNYFVAYWFAPLGLNEAQEAQEINAYQKLAEVAGITPILLGAACGSVVLYSFGVYLSQATSNKGTTEAPVFTPTWVMITALAAALLARVDGLALIRSYREQQNLREQAQVRRWGGEPGRCQWVKHGTAQNCPPWI